MYEDQRRFAEDPFNEDTVRVGDALLDEIPETQRSKWKEMIESTDFTHSSRKAWKTINKLTKDYTEPQQQCKVTADQVAHQLLLNGKGNKLHVPRREKMPRQTVTESKLTSPFLMEDLLDGVKALKNNKAAGLDDMLCEQIKHFGEATLRWILQMMNSILKTHNIPKAMEEVKSDRHPQTRKRLYITKELQTNLTVVSNIQVVRTYDPKPTEPTDRNHDYRSASWIQTRKVYNRTTTQLDTTH